MWSRSGEKIGRGFRHGRGMHGGGVGQCHRSAAVYQDARMFVAGAASRGNREWRAHGVLMDKLLWAQTICSSDSFPRKSGRQHSVPCYKPKPRPRHRPTRCPPSSDPAPTVRYGHVRDVVFVGVIPLVMIALLLLVKPPDSVKYKLAVAGIVPRRTAPNVVFAATADTIRLHWVGGVIALNAQRVRRTLRLRVAKNTPAEPCPSVCPVVLKLTGPLPADGVFAIGARRRIRHLTPPCVVF